MQQLGYLPLSVGDTVVSIPEKSADGTFVAQEPQRALTFNKYPVYLYVHSFKGSGWVPSIVIAQGEELKIERPVLSKEIYRPDHLHRAPEWFQENPQSVAEFIMMHGMITPVWALRGEEENRTVEAKFEHHHPRLGLVVTDLSGKQVVTYYPPEMRHWSEQPPSCRQRVAGHTQFSVSEAAKAQVKSNFQTYYADRQKKREACGRLRVSCVGGSSSSASHVPRVDEVLLRHPTSDCPHD